MRIVDLLKQPALNLELLCGTSNVKRHIRRTVSVSVADPSPWLDGDDLVLLTDRRELSDARTQAEFVRSLESKSAAGVVISREGARAADTSGLIAACAAIELPLLITKQVNFERLASAIGSRAPEAAAADTESIAIGALLIAVSNGLGIHGILEAIADSINSSEAFVLGPYNERIAASHPNAALWADAIVARDMYSHTEGIDAFEHANRSWLVSSIHVSERMEGYLLVCLSAGDLGAARNVFPIALGCLQLEMLKATPARVARRSRFSTLLEIALQSPHTANALKAGLEDLGVMLTDGYCIIAVAPPVAAASDTSLSKLCTALEDSLSELESPVATVLDEVAVGLIRDVDPPLNRVAGTIRRAGIADARIGVSYVRYSAAELAEAVSEAVAAATSSTSGGMPVHVHEAGSDAIAALLRRSYFAAAYSHEVLQGLYEYDRTQSGDLLHTLRTYFDSDFNVNEVARRLFIHRHTLNYRLKQVESITGLNPRAADGSLQLQLALRLHRESPPIRADGSTNEHEVKP